MSSLQSIYVTPMKSRHYSEIRKDLESNLSDGIFRCFLTPGYWNVDSRFVRNR